MKYSLSAVALFAAAVSADKCASGSTQDGGNFYCQQVNAITYQGVGGSGSYNKITAMDGTTGTCQSTPQAYSGSLAPFDEEVSVHFRGPLVLKQFAVYVPATSSSGKSSSQDKHKRRHMHGNGHAYHAHHKREAEADAEPGLGDAVSVVMDGKLVSWANTFSGSSLGSPAPAPQKAAPPAVAFQAAAPPASAPPAYGNNEVTSASNSAPNPPPSYGSHQSSSTWSESSSGKKGTSKPHKSSAHSPSGTGGSGWVRQAYYNSEQHTADGLVFLNHHGGSGSGVFDYTFGNSLSYASADGKSGSSSPQVLQDSTLPSNTEVIIFSDRKCSDGHDGCGYSRQGTVAYHGFGGPDKAFFVEFGMPDDGNTGASQFDPVNMPAIWILNAQIPRTLQYGKAECSCWKTGCGEFDIFEVLASGDTRCKSTLQGNNAGGDSDYFARPTQGTIKAALLLHDDHIHIKILDDSATFEKTMDNTFIHELCSTTMDDGADGLSIFNLLGLSG